MATTTTTTADDLNTATPSGDGAAAFAPEKGTFDPLANLSQKQLDTLKEFRERVTKIDMTDAERSFFCNDMSLLRYLRARDYTIDKSFKMMEDTIDWRRNYKPELVVSSEVEPMLKAGCIYMSPCKDKKGRPIIYARPYRDPKEKIPAETKVRHLVYWVEQGLKLMDASQGVETFTLITDYKDFGRRNMETKVNMESLQILNSHNPERMGLSLFLDPPLYFWVVWKMISPFLSAATHAKVKFVYSQKKDGRRVCPDMLEYIDADNLEEEFGGNLKYDFDYKTYIEKYEKK